MIYPFNTVKIFVYFHLYMYILCVFTLNWTLMREHDYLQTGDFYNLVKSFKRNAFIYFLSLY